MLRNARELEHYELRAVDGAIGEVADFLFDDQGWTVRYIVIETGGWLARRRVLISPVAVSRAEWDERVLAVSLTQEQVRSSPALDADRPSRDDEAALAQYYQWPAYWAGFPDVPFAPPKLPPPVEAPRPDAAAAAPAPSGVAQANAPHVHSVRAVRGRGVAASDGGAGEVEDFLLDDRSWEIRYLLVDPRKWWPGKPVVVATQWIRAIEGRDGCVEVSLTREAIRTSPGYEPGRLVTPDYPGQLAASDRLERQG